jgi:hypothetical protein
MVNINEACTPPSALQWRDGREGSRSKTGVNEKGSCKRFCVGWVSGGVFLRRITSVCVVIRPLEQPVLSQPLLRRCIPQRGARANPRDCL